MKKMPFQNTFGDIAGSVADIGVMVPLLILLIVKNGMNPTAVLAFTGCVYMVSGWLFRLPVAVQPLKAVSIIAIASNLPPTVITAAAMLMGIIMLFLAVTGMSGMLSRVFNRPMVRGIQLGVGALLVGNGIRMILDPQFLRDGGKVLFTLFQFDVPAGLLVGGIGAMVLLLLSANRRIPASLVLLLMGVVTSFFFGSLQSLKNLTFAPAPIEFCFPGKEDFLKAFILLVIPQLPLTFGNSIVATVDVARKYFGPRSALVTPERLSLSIGVTNLLAGVIGAAPLCHGAGGMTAHYRFGARSGMMGAIIGSCFVVLGLVFGKSAVQLFVLLPPSILGVMLVYIGIEHAMLIRDIMGSKDELFVALSIGTVAAATSNIFAATVVGFFLVGIFRVRSWAQYRMMKLPSG